MVRPLLLAVTTVSALLLAGCGNDATPRTAPTPVFGAPSSAAAPGSGPAAPPAATPSAAAGTEPTAAAPTGPTPTGATPTGPATAPGAHPTGPFRYVFPVRSDDVDFHPTHSKYPATDIFADCGEPAVAAVDGVVLEVSRSDHYVKGRPDGPLNGGLSVSLLGDDGVRYYGSHLSAVQAGIDAGVRVRAGQRLGSVGHTGNANGVCHLHFGISPPCARTGDWKVRRGVIWPADYLTAWRRNVAKSPARAVRAWAETHNCRA